MDTFLNIKLEREATRRPAIIVDNLIILSRRLSQEYSHCASTTYSKDDRFYRFYRISNREGQDPKGLYESRLYVRQNSSIFSDFHGRSSVDDELLEILQVECCYEEGYGQQ